MATTDAINASYNWSGGNFNNNTIANPTINLPGIYTLEVTNLDDNCARTIEVEVLEDQAAPEVTIENTFDLICDNNHLLVTSTTMLPDLSYQWESTNGTIVSDNTLENIEVDGEGLYNLIVTNTANGCTNSTSISTPDYMANAGEDLSLCEEDNLQLNANLPSSISSLFGTWTTAQSGINFTAVDDPNTSISNFTASSNQLIWTLFTDDCGAFSIDTLEVAYDDASYVLEDDALLVSSSDNEIEVNVIENDELSSGNWNLSIDQSNLPDGFTVFSSNNGLVQVEAPEDFAGSLEIPYMICSKVCPDNCSEANILLQVMRPDFGDTDVAFIITPGRVDGMNDFLPIEGAEEYPENEVFIFNRWGSIVNQLKNYDNQSVRFDGTNGNGKELPEGTYYYLAKLNIGEGEFRYGSVTVRRE